MELNQLNDQQVAIRMIAYIERVESLMSNISSYLNVKKVLF